MASLFDAFMGDAQADDIKAAGENATAAINKGLTDYTGTANEFLDRSVNFLQPDITNGQDATNMLRVALGLDGPEAQAAFFNDFQNDPQVNALIQQGNDSLDKSAASRGMLLSGNQLKAVAGNTANITNDVFNRRLDRLTQLGQTGSGQSTTAAGITQQTGQGIADAQFGTGQLLANQSINQGNALAANRNTPINNLLGVVGAGANVAKAFTGAPLPMGA